MEICYDVKGDGEVINEEEYEGVFWCGGDDIFSISLWYVSDWNVFVICNFGVDLWELKWFLI